MSNPMLRLIAEATSKSKNALHDKLCSDTAEKLVTSCLLGAALIAGLAGTPGTAHAGSDTAKKIGGAAAIGVGIYLLEKAVNGQSRAEDAFNNTPTEYVHPSQTTLPLWAQQFLEEGDIHKLAVPGPKTSGNALAYLQGEVEETLKHLNVLKFSIENMQELSWDKSATYAQQLAAQQKVSKARETAKISFCNLMLNTSKASEDGINASFVYEQVANVSFKLPNIKSLAGSERTMSYAPR